MQIGMIGLGRMGSNMVRRLIRQGHSCVVFNRSLTDAELQEWNDAVDEYHLRIKSGEIQIGPLCQGRKVDRRRRTLSGLDAELIRQRCTTGRHNARR